MEIRFTPSELEALSNTIDFRIEKHIALHQLQVAIGFDNIEKM